MLFIIFFIWMMTKNHEILVFVTEKWYPTAMDLLLSSTISAGFEWTTKLFNLNPLLKENAERSAAGFVSHIPCGIQLS